MMKQLKNQLRKCFLTKNLYRFLSKAKGFFHKIKLRESIRIDGEKTIHDLEKILKNTSLLYFFDMGTLLGIIREGKILDHDLDIDIGMYIISEQEREYLIDLLQKNNCNHKYSFYVDELGFVEDSFVLNNIKFDINYYFKSKDCDDCYLMYNDPEKPYNPDYLNVVKLSCKPIFKTCKKEFGNAIITIPANAESYLAERYGENWRIPDLNYIYWKGPSASKTEYKGIIEII